MKRNKIYCSAIHTVTQSNNRSVDRNVAFMKLGLKGNAKLAQTRICMGRIVYRDAKEISVCIFSSLQCSSLSSFFFLLSSPPPPTSYAIRAFCFFSSLHTSHYFPLFSLPSPYMHHLSSSVDTQNVNLFSLLSPSLCLPLPVCLLLASIL